MHLTDCSCPHHQQPRLSSRHQAPIPAEGETSLRDNFRRTPSAERGFDLANLDHSVRPQDNFYQFAVGGWRKAHEIPSHKTSVGSFDQLAERNREALHTILEGLSQSTAPAGSDERKLADFYASGMDTATIEAAGARPLQPIFERIEAVSNTRELFDEVAHLHSAGVGAMFGFYCTQDFKNSTQNIGEVAQGDLGLRELDYYFKDDDKSKEIRQAYQDHIQRTFQLLGDSPDRAADGAAKVMALETRLVEALIGHKRGVVAADADRLATE